VNAHDYYRHVQELIHAISPFVVASDLAFNEIDTNECYIRGSLTLVNGFELHIAEYVITAPSIQRLKYRYHLQDSDGVLVSRWDNVPHHRHIPTFPHHRHDAQNVVHPSEPMDIEKTLQSVIPLVS
jgi:hypothetical protein